MTDKYKKDAIRNMRKLPYAQDRDRDFWTEDERNQLREMFDTGEDLSEIALVLQRTEFAVCQQATSMGLCVRKRRTKNERSVFKCLCKKCTADQSDCPIKRQSKEGANCCV